MKIRELQLAMHAAWNAGLDEGLVMTWLPNAEPVIRLREGDLEGYIFASPTHVFLAFQGTEMETGDLWTDLNYKRVRVAGAPGRWHQGFTRGAASFLPTLFWLKDNLKGRKLIVTGFSLGAALAQAMSLYLTQGKVLHTVYAFGGPRIASPVAGRWLARRAQHYRVHTYDDWVPHLPPYFFGFKHFGNLGVLNQHGTLLEGPRAWWRAGLWPRKVRHGHHRLRYLLLILNL